MIIQIRGTSGSGKSTAMKWFMKGYNAWEAVYAPGRKKPLWYFSTANGLPRVVVLGHYDSPCGGCDTIGSAKAVYDLIQVVQGHFKSHAVVCEGLLLSEDVKWSSQMKDLTVLYLQTPLDQCLRQIESRRAEAGNEKPLDPRNTSNRFRVVEKSRVRLLEAGVTCLRTTVRQVPGLITKLVTNV